MKNPRINALILAAALTLVALGHTLGTRLTAAFESYMTATTAHAVSTIGE